MFPTYKPTNFAPIIKIVVTTAAWRRDKERLLSEDEPLRFIFSHSALKEGWDFINQVSDVIQRERHSVTVKGIQYEKIGGAVYEVHQIQEEAECGITRYLGNFYEALNQDKTLYDFVEYMTRM